MPLQQSTDKCFNISVPQNFEGIVEAMRLVPQKRVQQQTDGHNFVLPMLQSFELSPKRKHHHFRHLQFPLR